MTTLIIVLHVLVCIALVVIVLLQSGKGAEMGAAFGGASQTLFGGSGGSSFMSKLTTGAAVVFMITCLLLSMISKRGLRESNSLMNVRPPVTRQQTKPPAQPLVPQALPVRPAPSAK
ncbi:MAG: preprotein translocase subunit SecG [Deltaproteobacteria bacterium]|nr:preprotein translocase subunit SecG [Deltaproteobacteria bacterium]MDA8308140.1 preprotein translocase subunit SecG [Deltaproteobacteria bacterium]